METFQVVCQMFEQQIKKPTQNEQKLPQTTEKLLQSYVKERKK